MANLIRARTVCIENHPDSFFRVITLSKAPEIRQLLAEKRMEYQKRIVPSEPTENHIDPVVRIHLIYKLLRDGKADPFEVVNELLENGIDFHTKDVRRAIEIIRDYAETGGKNLVHHGQTPE